MKYCLIGHDLRHAVEEMLLHLLPEEIPEFAEQIAENEEGAIVSLTRTGDEICASADIYWGGRTLAGRRCEKLKCSDALEQKRVQTRLVKFALYDAVMPALAQPPVWGALTGVRPAKLARLLLEGGHTESEVRGILGTEYHVSAERVDLTMQATRAAVTIDSKLSQRGVSIYIGIPFCPSRCSYCSFVSAVTERTGELIEPYLDMLCQEIVDTGRLLRETGHTIDSVYVGGGTPTILSAAQLDRLLAETAEAFDLTACQEITVEAGRPDTITVPKLQVLKNYEVERISINPQSMDDEVLARVGRRHSAADIMRAYEQARCIGFAAINMDTIAGLAGDTAVTFANTIDTLVRLRPENITVHTLAIKRGADLSDKAANVAQRESVSRMLTYAGSTLSAVGYAPYYLYRQKFSAGGMENVGWCLSGTACLYNVAMMEELQTIISLGAGGVSKRVVRETGEIKRFNNPKYPMEYMRAGERLMQGKRNLLTAKN